jgi:hypothetical protein
MILKSENKLRVLLNLYKQATRLLHENINIIIWDLFYSRLKLLRLIAKKCDMNLKKLKFSNIFFILI